MRVLVERFLEDGEQIPADLTIVSAVRTLQRTLMPDPHAPDRTYGSSRWVWQVIAITEQP